MTWQIDALSPSCLLVIGGVSLFAMGSSFIWSLLLHRQMTKRARSLDATTSHLRTAFEAIREAIAVCDADGMVVRTNARMANMFGLPIEAGTTMRSFVEGLEPHLVTADDFTWLIEQVGHPAGPSVRYELTLENPERTVSVYINPILEADGVVRGRLWVFEDVTQRRQMETRLIQAKKMETIGQLSGGIAHDFNNFLTVIRSSLAMLRLHGPHQDNHVQDCHQIAELAVNQAIDLTQQLLDFARRSRLERRHIRVNEMLRELHMLLCQTGIAEEALIVEFDADDSWVDVDPNRMQRALFNLCLNAWDSLQGCEDGRIRIRADRVPDARHRSFLCLTVEDNGCGMDPETMKRIFEPFYTTKAVGSGTGLGLSVAQGVIEQHDGRIQVHSQLGKGTRFDISLPVCSAPAHWPTEQAREAWPNRPAGRLTESMPLRVLLVDDHPLVRQSGASLLRALHHEVEVAENGMQALHKLAACGGFDVVLLDIVMPELSGLDTFQEIRSAWPDQRVVFCSAYAKGATSMQQFGKAGPPPLLCKPFEPETLSQCLHDVVASPVWVSDPPTANNACLLSFLKPHEEPAELENVADPGAP